MKEIEEVKKGIKKGKREEERKGKKKVRRMRNKMDNNGAPEVDYTDEKTSKKTEEAPKNIPLRSCANLSPTTKTRQAQAKSRVSCADENRISAGHS